MAFTDTLLYGGAITVDLPSGFADASQVRQIPDHQEVYLDAAGYSSVVIEILEYVEKSSDEEALQYHFADLVEGTGDSTNMLSQKREAVRRLGDKPVYSLTFIQTPPPPDRPNRKLPEFVYIHLLLVRLKENASDVMITINIPHYVGEYDKAMEGEPTKLMKDSDILKEKMLETFNIIDWGLFDG